MPKGLMVAVLVVAGVVAHPASVPGFSAGVFVESATDSTCVQALPGTSLVQVVWAEVPVEIGTVYITLRFEFAANIGLRAQPVFNDLVTEVVYTEYPDGSVEWNMVLTGCPGGFIRLFAHRIEVLDTAPARVGIRGGDSWIRGCDFELRRVDTTNDLRINGPECSGVAITPGSWSRTKARY